MLIFRLLLLCWSFCGRCFGSRSGCGFSFFATAAAGLLLVGSGLRSGEHVGVVVNEFDVADFCCVAHAVPSLRMRVTSLLMMSYSSGLTPLGISTMVCSSNPEYWYLAGRIGWVLAFARRDSPSFIVEDNPQSAAKYLAGVFDTDLLCKLT